jgi:putative inner membrane exporter YdcZ
LPVSPEQVALALEQLQQSVDVRKEPIEWRRARPQRRLAAHQLVLDRALLLVEEGQRQTGAIAEAVEDGALGAGHAAPQSAGWIAFAALAGAALPVQGAINAQLRADLDAPITAALWSFVVATAAMAAVFAVFAARGRAPAPRAAALRSVPWWGWLGGLCGATYVTAVFLLIRTSGWRPRSA